LNRSPGTRRKAKAPLPPPSSSSQQIPHEQINNPIESAISESTTSNQYLTGNENPNDKEKKGTKSLEESSPQSNQFKNIYKRFTKGFFKLLFARFSC
jgi:hypothetical protein